MVNQCVDSPVDGILLYFSEGYSLKFFLILAHLWWFGVGVLGLGQEFFVLGFWAMVFSHWHFVPRSICIGQPVLSSRKFYECHDQIYSYNKNMAKLQNARLKGHGRPTHSITWTTYQCYHSKQWLSPSKQTQCLTPISLIL